MIELAKCLECGGKAVKDGLFYKCLNCGLTMTLQEFSRQLDRSTASKWSEQVDEDDGVKKKRQNDMMKWFTKSQDDYD